MPCTQRGLTFQPLGVTVALALGTIDCGHSRGQRSPCLLESSKHMSPTCCPLCSAPEPSCSLCQMDPVAGAGKGPLALNAACKLPAQLGVGGDCVLWASGSIRQGLPRPLAARCPCSPGPVTRVCYARPRPRPPSHTSSRPSRGWGLPATLPLPGVGQWDGRSVPRGLDLSHELASDLSCVGVDTPHHSLDTPHCSLCAS